MSSTNDPVLRRAILHLLVQAAWADLEVSTIEAEHILKAADKAGLDDDELERLKAALRGEITLPPPDLGYLRAHKKEVLLAIGGLISADDNIVEEEKEFFDQIKEMLK